MYCLALCLVVIVTAVNFRHLLCGVCVYINQAFLLYIGVFDSIILFLVQGLLIKYAIWQLLLRLLNRLIKGLWWSFRLLLCQMVWLHLLFGFLLAHDILEILNTVEAFSVVPLLLLELGDFKLLFILMNNSHRLLDFYFWLWFSIWFLTGILSRFSVALFNGRRNDVFSFVEFRRFIRAALFLEFMNVYWLRLLVNWCCFGKDVAWRNALDSAHFLDFWTQVCLT